MKRLVVILIILIILLYAQIYRIININYINKEKSNIKYYGSKILELNNDYGLLDFEHLNIKGKIVNIENNIEIKLSDNSKKFLRTEKIFIENINQNLEVGNDVFIVFQGIQVQHNKMFFNSLRVYKNVKEIEIQNVGKSKVICKNSYGGLLKITGREILYNNNKYFVSDVKLNEDEDIYYIDIEDDTLLYEEYKDVIYPKVYNMLNYQETNFEAMIEIYK